MITRSFRPSIVMAILAIAGCAHVDVTKTGRGTLAPTNPNDVEVLMTKPDRRYVELGTLTANGYSTGETAKMHNALRAKAAPLGATAVIVTDSGQLPGGFGGAQMWVNAVAVRWVDAKP